MPDYNNLRKARATIIEMLNDRGFSVSKYMKEDYVNISLDEIEKQYLFPQLIDGAVYSFNVGYRKPETNIYRIAADNANVLPENCIFIDDQYENIQSAIRFGFTGIHFKSYEQLEMDLIQHKLNGINQR